VVEDLTAKLSPDDRNILEFQQNSINPDDGKYAKAANDLRPYLSPAAEWRRCADIQLVLLETREEFGQAEAIQVVDLRQSIKLFNPLNVSLLEDQVTHHDQLAVIEELGRHVQPATKALLHPGTTSYDILDTARATLFIDAWDKVMKPAVVDTINQYISLAEKSEGVIKTARTHLQSTAPIPYTSVFSGYAARIARRAEKLDTAIHELKGKMSGIVGTGASIEMVVGEGNGLVFEKRVLEKLGLEPDYTATQIVQKEELADVGHQLTTLAWVIADFANDMRLSFSTGIGEASSVRDSKRLKGSSADALKINPITWENLAGKVITIEADMRSVYSLISSDFERDLRGSVVARYEPQGMMARTYEMITRLNKALPDLVLVEDVISNNLQKFRDQPGEAMVAITRGYGWSHSTYGVGHSFVAEMGKKARQTSSRLIDVAIEDPEFNDLFTNSMTDNQRSILNGNAELYTGFALERAEINRDYASDVIERLTTPTTRF